MGDCRIRIVVARSLLSNTTTTPSKNDDDVLSSSSSSPTVSLSSIYSSDTTIREVFEGNEAIWKLLFDNNASYLPSTCKLWDCTIYPPVDITSWPLTDFPELLGPKSKTLHSAGWFPSGTILVIPPSMTPNQFSDLQSDEDVQYNQTLSVGRHNDRKVEFVDPTLLQRHCTDKPLPSQVMASVANRFDNDDSMSSAAAHDPQAEARLLQQQHKRERKQREMERANKLEARIARLEDQQQQQSNSNKNKAVSEQVLKMLVKSRAIGDPNLKMIDRLYFQCLVVTEEAHNDDNAAAVVVKEYRYFSPQDTFAKIANTFVMQDQTKNLRSEVLCRRKMQSQNNKAEIDAPGAVHRRFPVAMRVYEAVAAGYLAGEGGVDSLIIRFYSEEEDPTLSILENDVEDAGGNEQMKSEKVTAEDVPIEMESLESVSSKEMSFSPNPLDIEFEDLNLAHAIHALDDKEDTKRKTSTKKSSAAALKVKQMKMKSNSKGDTKRIPKMEDRFFLEVITISENESAATSTFCFLAKTDPLERILHYCDATTKVEPDSWDFLVPSENIGRFRPIRPTSTTTQVLEDQGVIRSFGRLILLRRRSS
jgi:hypothetical protein